MAWTNEAGLNAANRANTGGAAAMRNYGDVIWETICFFGLNGTFNTNDVVSSLMKELNLTRSSAYSYWSAFMAYAKAAPEDFSGPTSKLVRVRRGVYCLDNNPER